MRNWGVVPARHKIAESRATQGNSNPMRESSEANEAQFSNYPFLLNNVVRSELFTKANLVLDSNPVDSVIIITKASMFPASNSTLYFEQAVNQLDELNRHHVFDVPMRVVGLFENISSIVDALWSEYTAARYSRTITKQRNRKCKISPGKRANSRCVLSLSR